MEVHSLLNSSAGLLAHKLFYRTSRRKCARSRRKCAHHRRSGASQRCVAKVRRNRARPSTHTPPLGAAYLRNDVAPICYESSGRKKDKMELW